MKKLMTFCFIILFSVLSALSCFNFAFDALDRIERDKITIVIEKPSNISATDFLGEIDRVTEELHTDIMLRRVENRNGKAHYQYFKTSHTADFLKISTSKGNAQLGNGECISTITPAGYNVQTPFSILSAASVFASALSTIDASCTEEFLLSRCNLSYKKIHVK